MIRSNRFPTLAEGLVLIHKTITRGITVGINETQGFLSNGFQEEGTRKGFTDYINALAVVLHSHHTAEDDIVFPSFREKLPFVPYELLTANHREVAEILSPVQKWISEMDGIRDEARLSNLLNSLNKLFVIWEPHIGIEENNFSQNALEASIIPEEQNRLWAAISKHNEEHAAPGYLSIPFVLFNLTAEDRGLMAATMPSIVTDNLIPKDWLNLWTPMKPFLLE
jgi:hypothetical protein